MVLNCGRADPSQTRANELFNYDRDTGILSWKIDRSWNAKAGMVAGTINNSGYYQIRVDGRIALYHRIAWIIENGSIPRDLFIDHINGNSLDNRICNLRTATEVNNKANVHLPRKDKTCSKYKGVRYYARTRKWTSEIMHNKKRLHLGCFNSEIEAYAAYRMAKISLNSNYANPSAEEMSIISTGSHELWLKYIRSMCA